METALEAICHHRSFPCSAIAKSSERLSIELRELLDWRLVLQAETDMQVEVADKNPFATFDSPRKLDLDYKDVLYETKPG